MLLLGYALCDAYVMEAWNTPGTKGDSAQLCYSDKIAGGRYTLVIVFKLKTKESFKGPFLKDMIDVLSLRDETARND